MDHRYVIIGAGPGGLQLSYFLHRAGADYVTLEREAAPGSFFRRYPRHRRLISLNKVHAGTDDPEIRLRWDWNSLLNDRLLFADYSSEYLPHADDLVRYLTDFQREHDLNVRFSTAVDRVEREGDGFRVHAGEEVLRARCVIVATGWGGPHVPGIEGIDLATGYEDMEVEGAAYTGRRVLIIGKGNSAFETAQRLLDHASLIHLASPHPVRLAWTTKHPGDVRGQYGAFLDSYWFKTLHGVLECDVDRLWRDGDVYKASITYTMAEGEQEVLEYDDVLRCTGFTMDTGLFGESCRPALEPGGRIPSVGTDWQSANVDGLYFAGTLMQARDFKRASSAFIDGFRYNLRTLAVLLRERYEGVAIEGEPVPGELAEAMLDHLNWNSAVWAQFEFLCDVYVVEADGGRVTRYRDLPEEYAIARFADEPHVYTVSLRWGRAHYGDVFAIRRHPVPERADECAFIHPVIRRLDRGELVGEQHLLEDLNAQWRRTDRHLDPLRGFLGLPQSARESTTSQKLPLRR